MAKKKNTFANGGEARAIISAIGASTKETGDHIDNALKGGTAAIAASTKETGQHIEDKGDSILAAIFGHKTIGFIVLSVVLAVILGFVLFWLFGLPAFQVPTYDRTVGTFLGFDRDIWTYVISILISLGFLVWMIYATNWGLKKKGEGNH